jgi:hypothetical protein
MGKGPGVEENMVGMRVRETGVAMVGGSVRTWWMRLHSSSDQSTAEPCRSRTLSLVLSTARSHTKECR